MLVAGLLTAGVSSGAAERVSLRVSPTVAMAPASLATGEVEPADENRSIQIIAESDEFYRSSEVLLDGGRAARTNLFEFRGLPAGAYQVRAILKGVSGKSSHPRTHRSTSSTRTPGSSSRMTMPERWWRCHRPCAGSSVRASARTGAARRSLTIAADAGLAAGSFDSHSIISASTNAARGQVRRGRRWTVPVKKRNRPSS